MKHIIILIFGLFLLIPNTYGQLSFEKSIDPFLSISDVTIENKNLKETSIENFVTTGRDWYISKNKGSGQLGTKAKPAKDLGNIIHHLKPNDIIHIAGGIYMSKGKRGADEINVPVKIYGGYDESFTTRDPWGAYKTIFTGTNEYKKLTDARLYIRTDQQRGKNGQLSQGGEIIVDGIIVDNGPRNRYHQDKNLAIRRKASAKSGKNPSPESGGIVIIGSKYMNITVQNCVVMNTAPTQGALSVQVFKGGQGLIQNNFCINNTGYGIYARTGYAGGDAKELPKFTIRHNTTLFNWKHDPIASYGGNGLSLDQNLKATIENNVFAFGHMGGVYNKGADIKMNNNLFTGNSKYDYKEINDMMRVEDLLDEAAKIDPYSEGNETALIKISVAPRWAEIYGNRVEISRADVDAAVSANNSGANQLRSMLGMSLRGNGVKMDAEIFLPLIEIDEALPAGQMPWNGKGCFAPK